MSYLSDKIKSNTLKISSAEMTEEAASSGSHSTASHSDLSINEVNLKCFKEYMILTDRREDLAQRNNESRSRIQSMQIPTNR